MNNHRPALSRGAHPPHILAGCIFPRTLTPRGPLGEAQQRGWSLATVCRSGIFASRIRSPRDISLCLVRLLASCLNFSFLGTYLLSQQQGPLLALRIFKALLEMWYHLHFFSSFFSLCLSQISEFLILLKSTFNCRQIKMIFNDPSLLLIGMDRKLIWGPLTWLYLVSRSVGLSYRLSFTSFVFRDGRVCCMSPFIPDRGPVIQPAPYLPIYFMVFPKNLDGRCCEKPLD